MANEIKFTKMHGCGNDFILIEDLEGRYCERLIKNIAQTMCERRFGIGADSLLYITSSKKGDARMRIFESDGSESDMCGNGIRCVAAYLQRKGFEFPLEIETNAGLKKIQRNGRFYRVNMGTPSLRRKDVLDSDSKDRMLEEEVEVDGKKFVISVVNTGEPHVILFEDNLEEVNVARVGRMIRNSSLVPKCGANIDFVKVINSNTIEMRVYERGVEDETLACGTGATASAIISYLTRSMDNEINVKMKGGTVRVFIQRDLMTFMEGPATFVFKGSIANKYADR